MIINHIIIENLGLLYGKNKFIFKPKIKNKRHCPITIIGGKNGSGKTTIFEAIRLCLYGKYFLPNLSQKKYDDYLKEKIHHSKDLLLQPTYARIELEFEYAKFGKSDTFVVIREWENLKNAKIKETVTILKNNIDLNEIDKDLWQDFINDLLPIGLSELFFFDGEKIQSMMSTSNNVQLINSIKGMIGVDILERLYSDLKIYKSKKLNKKNDKNIRAELQCLEKEKEKTEAETKKIKDNIASIENHIRRIKNEIIKYEEKITAQGGDFSKKKDNLVDEKKNLEKELDIIKNNIKEIVSNLFPVTIANQLATDLKTQLFAERKRIRLEEAETILKSKNIQLFKGIKQDKFWNRFKNIDSKFKEEFLKRLTDYFSALNFKSEYKNIEMIHNISKNETVALINKIDKAINKIPDNLNILVKKYEETYRRLEKIYSNLEKVPEDEIVAPMFEKLNNYNMDLGGKLKQKEVLEKNLNTVNNNYNNIIRKIELCDKKISENKKINTKICLVEKTEKVLTKYIKKLSLNKLGKIEKEFTRIFNKLHRKKDLVKYIKIDPSNFEVYLFNYKNKSINKKSLSSGEAEIYAMSILWALIKVSGRNLPFIIDTPLGRLDSEHRDNLIADFFTKASHQMLIFSTDTEIDDKYFKKLNPYISQGYQLEYDKNKEQTTVNKGYFWK